MTVNRDYQGLVWIVHMTIKWDICFKFSLKDSSFMYNNHTLIKELYAGWSIPAFEFGQDFAFGWAYGWNGTKVEIWVRLAYHRAHCVRICWNISQSNIPHSSLNKEFKLSILHYPLVFTTKTDAIISTINKQLNIVSLLSNQTH